MAKEIHTIAWEERLAQRGFLQGLRVQVRVIGALMMRDTMSRFGRENLGFFWLMGEPLILTVGVMTIWTFIGQSHGRSVNVLAFVLTGYSMLTLWRHIISKSVLCFRHSAGLLFHRNIKPLDTLIARALLDTVGVGMAFFIAYTPLYLLGVIEPIHDYLLLIGAWLLLAWISFAFGIILAAMTEMADVIEKFVGPVLYFMIPISGTFFMVEWLPEKYHSLAGYSALINLNEMFRDGLMGNQIITHWDVPYVIYWCLGLTVVGLALARKARARIRFD